MTGQQHSAAESGWLRRDEDPAVDDAESVVLTWRTAAGRTQTEVTGVLGTTQQHLSQIETGQRPVSLELRRRMVTELGIAAEDLGLSSGCARELVSRDDASPQIAASRLCWRDERRWLNRYRFELAQLAVRLYPVEHRLPRTHQLTHLDWLAAEPVELSSLALQLDEGPLTAEIDGSEPESERTRPLRTARAAFRALYLGDQAPEPTDAVRVAPELSVARCLAGVAPVELWAGSLFREARRR